MHVSEKVIAIYDNLLNLPIPMTKNDSNTAEKKLNILRFKNNLFIGRASKARVDFMLFSQFFSLKLP
jgi:hypothetical protein